MSLVSLGLSAEPPRRSIELTYTPQLESVVGRRMLGHLISCALEKEVVATATVTDESFSFRGSYGLAPQWFELPPSEPEQRWVSACILAMVNYFGVGVAILLRAPGLDLPSLVPTEKELKRFTVHEGGYFGNLFATKPMAFVCQGAWVTEGRMHPGSRKRICAELAEDRDRLSTGTGLSRCGFRLVGPCGQGPVQQVSGQSYREVVHVFLAPLAHN